MSDMDFVNTYAEYKDTFDTVFALNVVEHIKDDSQALKNCRFLLKKGGNLIILVPAYQCLYNNFDVELGHYRRYSKNTLRSLFYTSNFNIIHTQYFNLMGIAGWFLSGKILGKKSIPEGQMGLYNTLVPIIRILDKVTLQRMGLSVIMVGRK